MPDKKIKNGFYQEFAQKREQERQEEFYRKQYSIPKPKPLIIDNSPGTAAKILNWATDTLRIVGRILLYSLLFTLASVGMTVLLNAPLRAQIVQLLQGLF